MAVSQKDYDAYTDEGLMQLFQDGDSLAFHYLLNRHRGIIWSQVRKYFGPQADIEDVCQDVFLSIWKSRSSWKPGIAKFSTWLFRVTSNRCIDLLRQKREFTTDHNFDDMTSGLISAEERVSEQQVSSQLLKLLAALPGAQKTALQLFYYEDADIAQICHRMDLSEQAVRSLLKRGKQNLRAALSPAQISA